MFDPMKKENRLFRPDVYDQIEAARNHAEVQMAASLRDEMKPGPVPRTRYKVTVWISVADLDSGNVSVWGPDQPSDSENLRGPYANMGIILDDDKSRQAQLDGLAMLVFHMAPGRCSVQVLCEVLPDWAPNPRPLGVTIKRDTVGTVITDPLVHVPQLGVHSGIAPSALKKL
jgi:hypothetical protein